MDYREMYVEMGISKEVVDYSESVVKGLEERFKKIDEIAERILTLGHVPNHNYSDYLKVSTIKESKEVHNGKKCVEDILNSFKVVIDLQRELLEITDKANDEGTNALVSGYITEQEKDVWMYNAYLG